jgi:hypothetical protein
MTHVPPFRVKEWLLVIKTKVGCILQRTLLQVIIIIIDLRPQMLYSKQVAVVFPLAFFNILC